MAKVIDFRHGLTYFVQAPDSQFVKDLSKILRVLNVSTLNNCCTQNADLTSTPVSFDTTTGILNYITAAGKQAILDKTPIASPINVTATATATQIATGLVTSTSASAVSITLPTATALAAALGAVRGKTFELVVDNSAGANTVTIVPSASIAAGTAVLTGGATMTVASGATSSFKIIFTSTTAAKIFRIA